MPAFPSGQPSCPSAPPWSAAASSRSQAGREHPKTFPHITCPYHSSPSRSPIQPSRPPRRSSRSSGGHRRQPRHAPAGRFSPPNKHPNRTPVAQGPSSAPSPARNRAGLAGIAQPAPAGRPRGRIANSVTFPGSLLQKGNSNS
jgi:hypothetical protein